MFPHRAKIIVDALICAAFIQMFFLFLYVRISVKTVAFHTLGCKLNFSETSTLARSFKIHGFDEVAFPGPADVVVINTCSVTENADKECKALIRKVNRVSPDAFLALIGCYAQLRPQEIAALPGVDLVLGASEKFRLLHHVKSAAKQDGVSVHACEIHEANSFESAWSQGSRTRTFLKVQDGCDYPCSYCTIPLARGISRSDTVENIIARSYEIAENGAMEIVLTGVNIGDFGRGEHGNKKHDHTFLQLLEQIELRGAKLRYRISSIEPNLLSEEIISLVAASEKFMPHFHMPLQSGSDRILGLMRRRYRTDLYRSRTELIRKLIPDASIGVDVISGFPGETETHFEETHSFISQIPVSYLHAFTYSERANTPAAEMQGKVPSDIRVRRTNILRALSAIKQEEFYASSNGKEAEVLWETENKDGFMLGYTPNYIRVIAPFDSVLVNTKQIVKLKFSKASDIMKIEFAGEATSV
jgi:threonylcarbamoyladenosine tRNA methylthiotransferase MtaB